MTHKFVLLLVGCTFLATGAFASESTCFGRVAKGRLEGGVQLPARAKNYVTYSDAGTTLGRTYLHSKVQEIVIETYKALEKAAPDKQFVYGETGWKEGGRIKPHRTHQNGLSVDFMVPVKNADGVSVALPASPLNKFGYAYEFDRHGKSGGLEIDFDALAAHLYQLSAEAKKKNVAIALVIFDPPLLPKLFAARHGAYLKKNLPFMKGHAWIRHDEHYHIDFAVPCKPFKS